MNRRTAYRSYYISGSSYSFTYKLYWSNTFLTDLTGLQKITRQEAIHLAIAEQNRRKYDKTNSGKADALIWEYGKERKEINWESVPYPYMVE